MRAQHLRRKTSGAQHLSRLFPRPAPPFSPPCPALPPFANPLNLLSLCRIKQVTLHDHSSCTARVVGYDAAKDIAVLKLALPRGRLEALAPVSIGSSSRLRVGQACFAIGNPFGLDHTLTQVCVCV